MKRSLIGRLTLIVSVFAGVCGVLFAQAHTPIEGSAQDALLAEVRALRAELHQVASASIRMQLLVARLQLQEQRVLLADRQLVEVQNAVATVRQEIAGEQARVEQLEKSLTRTTQGQDQLQHAILEAKAQIERQQRQELRLQAREAECLRTVSDAQARWRDFSERLDALERSESNGN